MDAKRFEKEEPRLAKLFKNSRLAEHLSHAYLLSGESGAPLYECAMFMAKSLFCQKKLLACNQCEECHKFEENKHPDFTLIDGSKDMIKKGDIALLSEKYSMETIEKGHVGCYVMINIENINEEAANALLKFLEEPKSGLVAILTTTNLERCLKTIVSRSVVVRVDKGDFKELLSSTNDAYSKEHAYALSLFASDPSSMATLAKDDKFINAYQLAESFLNDLGSSWKKASYTLLKDGVDVLKDNETMKYFASIINKAFVDVLSKDKTSPFCEYVIALKAYIPVLPQAVISLETIVSSQNANMNTTLSLSKLLDSLRIG